ncbi:MAG: NADH-dependent [FeFe] hydrogenase, group A6 [Candidatus Woesearchaeota archaeon]
MKQEKQIKKLNQLKQIKLVIDNREVIGKQGQTILNIAQENDIEIPTFCFHPRLDIVGACRICVVEVEGFRNLQASCSTPAKDGMKIWTNSELVLHARRTVLELLLSNHELNCPTCEKNLQCKLQQYSSDLMVREMPFEGEKATYPRDDSSVSIARNPNKCIKCARCVRVCNDIQTVYAIENHDRGFYMNVAPPFHHKLADSSCINCGQCVVNCPVAALTEKSDIKDVVNQIRAKLAGRSNKHLVVQVAPSIRATIGECFGMPAGTPVTGKLVTALKRLGFDKVFDSDLAADMTIVEEATEFVKRFTSGKDLPLITTCCPAWIKFGEQFYFDQLKHMSTCKSPQAMMGSLIRSYYSKTQNIKSDDIYLVDIMPCTAKKFEIKRPEFAGDVDEILTTVELAKVIKMFGIDFKDLPDSDFDNPLGESTGAGSIFGRTGGVMEAALRTAADFISGEDIKEIEYKQVRGMNTIKEATLEIKGKKVNIAVIHTLGKAREVMESIKAGNCKYDFIEIMACYGGCVGGGGQPPVSLSELELQKRAEALNSDDRSKAIRKSHQNKTLIKLYDQEYGKFGSEKAHKYLHTHYVKREYIG